MSKLKMCLATIAALLGTGLIAVPVFADAVRAPAEPGALTVIDDAKIFSPEAITQAANKMKETKFDHGLHFTVDTYKEIPADRKSAYSKDKEKEFFKEWAGSVVRTDKDKGPYVLICKNPGWIEVLEDKETLNRGGHHVATNLKKIFLDAMKDSARQDRRMNKRAFAIRHSSKQPIL